MTPIINGLLEVREGDTRKIDFYLTGLLQPFRQTYADLHDDLKIHIAIPEDKVRELIKNILAANSRHIEMMKIAHP